jgi:hypothetical protein
MYSRAGFTILFLLSGWTCNAAAVQPEAKKGGAAESEVAFVQITDTHVGSDPASRARLKAVVDAINRLTIPIACVVVTGDISSHAALGWSEPKRILGGLKVPWHAAPGNHDLASVPEDAEAYRNSWGSLAGKAVYGGVLFLFLYDAPVTSMGYDPITWLDAALKAAQGTPAIVFHHVPAVGNFREERLQPGTWPDDRRAQWTSLLNRYRVVADITGHFHRDELHWLGEVPLYVAPPVVHSADGRAAYRVYWYKGGRLSYSTQYVE